MNSAIVIYSEAYVIICQLKRLLKWNLWRKDKVKYTYYMIFNVIRSFCYIFHWNKNICKLIRSLSFSFLFLNYFPSVFLFYWVIHIFLSISSLSNSFQRLLTCIHLPMICFSIFIHNLSLLDMLTSCPL